MCPYTDDYMQLISSTKLISLWHKITVSMPRNIYVFIIKASITPIWNFGVKCLNAVVYFANEAKSG
jgi:hypothetical protein